MKIKYLVLLGLMIACIFTFKSCKRYFDCNFSLDLGGGPGAQRPAYCDAKQKRQDKHIVAQFQQDFTFQCKIQQKPELSPETQQLYDYAYYHDLHNLWNEKAGVWDGLAHYYRIAAANGDYKANVRLQYLLEEEKIKGENNQKEVFELNKNLSTLLPATAFYKTYGAIENGNLTTEDYGQYKFLRKAAELGSAEAQFELSNIIMQIKDEPTHAVRLAFSNELEKCASENGYGEASIFYGMQTRDKRDLKTALQAFHDATKQGSNQGALRLERGFSIDPKLTQMEKKEKEIDPDLDLDLDLERSVRYQKISDYLFDNEHLNPKVPDLDQIVPLPPAKLPAWDGKIAFQRWYEGPSPEKPSEELVEKLAKAKSLDPKTGLPLKK